MRLKSVQIMTIVLGMSLALGAGIAAQGPGGGGQGRGAGAGAGAQGGGGAGRGGPAGGAQGPGLTLTSTAWQDGGEIPAKNAGGQAGQSISPPLTWTNVPMGTVEFVLIMNDPEPVMPRGSGSVTGDVLHWLIAKIPATTTSLPEGAGGAQGQLPAGAKQIQAYRGPGAGAAGPPHHYTLTLYALNAPLQLADNAQRADVMTAMEGKVLARAIFNGRFKQPQ